MKRKILLSIFIVLIQCFSANAQEFPDLPGQVFKMVKSWRNAIDSFFIKEDAERLSRNLGWLYQDFTDYLTIRKSVTDYLENNNYIVTNRDSLKDVISSVSTAIRKLYLRARDVNAMIISGTGSRVLSARETNKHIMSTMNSQQQMIVTKLYDYIHYNTPVNKGELKRESRRIYNEMEKASRMVTDIQSKVKMKFNIP